MTSLRYNFIQDEFLHPAELAYYDTVLDPIMTVVKLQPGPVPLHACLLSGTYLSSVSNELPALQ